ncbi:uncharacterized protein PAC_09423 [Phialocephala subalpina]|uniref:Uncharacterized protein n=1 Tax=Phialocephala subalpina TaxID=576137 RepID=A0A1L7X3C8_9HELO|nr:uncharacterized protein PAC_09423 [Phialocephala subalpina]
MKLFPQHALSTTPVMPTSKRSFAALETLADHTSDESGHRRTQARHIIHDLDITALREIALYAYTSNTEIATYIDSKYATISRKPPEPPKSFHSYTESCWEMLNVTYPALKAASDSTLYELRRRVLDVLEENRCAIIDFAGPKALWETRRNALEALRKICRNILLCVDENLQLDIVEDGKTLPEFASAMCRIADGMTKEERTRYQDEGLCDKLSQLKDECDWVINVPALEKLLDIFEFSGQDRGVVTVEATSPRARKRRRKAYYQSSAGERRSIQLPIRGPG